jgi:hypothetical protein
MRFEQVATSHKSRRLDMNDARKDSTPKQAGSTGEPQGLTHGAPAPSDRQAVDLEVVVVDKRNAMHVYAVHENVGKPAVEKLLHDATAVAHRQPVSDIRNIAMSMADAPQRRDSDT